MRSAAVFTGHPAASSVITARPVTHCARLVKKSHDQKNILFLAFSDQRRPALRTAMSSEGKVKREEASDDDEAPIKKATKVQASLSTCLLVKVDFKDVALREKIKGLGATWCKPLSGWILPESARAAARQTVESSGDPYLHAQLAKVLELPDRATGGSPSRSPLAATVRDHRRELREVVEAPQRDRGGHRERGHPRPVRARRWCRPTDRPGRAG